MLNFIPVLSAGRSGTNKLAELFSIENVYSEHESEPGFHTVRLSTDEVKDNFVSDKIAFYESTGMPNIVHTGHMMGLGFLEKFINSSVEIKDCIVLQRSWREIATSMFLLDWIPYKQKFIVPWYSGPDETGVLQYDGYETAHPYQLCYWWCLESDRRIKEQTKILQDHGVNIHYVNIVELLTLENFNDLLLKLGINQVSEIDTLLVNDVEKLSKYINFSRIAPPDSYLDMLEEEVYARTSYMGN
jgi:hypothetical protein